MMTNHRPVIFLDIDGVLNTPKFLEKQTDKEWICPDNLAAFCRMLDEWPTGLSEENNPVADDPLIVISSSRRFSHKFLQLRGILRDAGASDRMLSSLLGCTVADGTNAEDIVAWLEANPGVTNFVILDDNPMFNYAGEPIPHLASNFLWIDRATGFTDYTAKMVKKILTGGDQ